MRLAFRGWRREVTPHSHEIQPVRYTSAANEYQTTGEAGAALTWDGPLHALGKVSDVGLSGSFLVDFHFRPEELESWLRNYVTAEPEAALRLLSTMHAEATIALVKKTASAEHS